MPLSGSAVCLSTSAIVNDISVAGMSFAQFNRGPQVDINIVGLGRAKSHSLTWMAVLDSDVMAECFGKQHRHGNCTAALRNAKSAEMQK